MHASLWLRLTHGLRSEPLIRAHDADKTKEVSLHSHTNAEIIGFLVLIFHRIENCSCYEAQCCRWRNIWLLIKHWLHQSDTAALNFSCAADSSFPILPSISNSCLMLLLFLQNFIIDYDQFSSFGHIQHHMNTAILALSIHSDKSARSLSAAFADRAKRAQRLIFSLLLCSIE